MKLRKEVAMVSLAVHIFPHSALNLNKFRLPLFSDSNSAFKKVIYSLQDEMTGVVEYVAFDGHGNSQS